jgi:hypothetical protein
MTRTDGATQRSRFHQLGPVQPMTLPPGAERNAAIAICDRATSPADAVLLLTMCGLLGQG